MLTGLLFGPSSFKYPALMTVQSIVVAIAHQPLHMLYNIKQYFVYIILYYIILYYIILYYIILYYNEGLLY